MPIPKKRTYNPRNLDDRARAMDVAVALIKEYCEKTDAALWDQIINQNPTIKIPQILKKAGITVRKDGSANISDLMNIAHSTDKTEEDTATKETMGDCLSQLISMLSSQK